MKTFTLAAKNYYNQASRKRAIGISITRDAGTANEFTVRGTSWDEDQTIAGDVYYSTSGGALSDLDSFSALNVDNGEIKANFDAITSEDLQAGRWNGAAVELFVFDPDNVGNGKLETWNFTLGQITVERLSFVSELRGRMQILQQSLGWYVGPTCVHTLGDEMCQKDLTDFTKIGTLESVSDDGLTFTDSSRTEPGPTGGLDIVSITDNGDGTATVETDGDLNLRESDTVNLSDVVGPAIVNGPWQIRNPSGPRFDIPADIDGQPSFVSGTATRLGAESGYFDYGWMELTTGANSGKGIKREIKTYVDGGTWTIQQAFPYVVNGDEDYRLVAGCDKIEATCIDKFDNIVNFLGFRVKGNDWLMQVGRNQ